MHQNIYNLQRVLLVCFCCIALGLVYWQIVRADSLLRRDDNPRLILAEQRIRRGAIVTLDGTILVETVFDEDGFAERRYHYPSLSPVLGYYSLRYGTGGLEASYDSLLRAGKIAQAGKIALSNTWLNNLLHRPLVGQPLTVTLNLSAQLAADAALAEMKAPGAVLVLSSDDSQVLVLSSYPRFDPETLDEQWDDLVSDSGAPLLNRATQGIFPLGELVTLIEAIQILEGHATLTETAQQLHLDQEIDFSLLSSSGLMPDNLPEKAPELSATPLHIAWLGTALVRQGQASTPTLHHPVTASYPDRPLISPETAQALIPLAIKALVSPDVTGNEPLSWYLQVRGDDPWVIVAVVVTSQSDRDAAYRVAMATQVALRP